jgi:hypothetical protein
MNEMLIEIYGCWINPDHIVRLKKYQHNRIAIVLITGELFVPEEIKSLSEVAGLINRSIASRK